ncbi:MAG: hypothetical protein PHI44_05535, partial [Candidatus Ratteibacteria bacterium]|nr:hypothetical protein [Candidatus Ratteibacteria bacterium]
MTFYQYTKVKNYQYTTIEKGHLYNRGLLSFPSAFTSGYSFNDTVYVDIFEPSGKDNWSAIILAHSWMESKNGITEWFARELAKNGYGTYLIHLPYHIKRTNKKYKSGSLFITPDVDRSVDAYRQAVIDIMSLCDWLEGREEIVKDSIGMVGISLGALILNTVMGLDNRIRPGISILGGGNIHYIFVRGLATLPQIIYGMLHGLRIRDYRKVSKDYIHYLKKVRKAGDVEGVHCPWKWFLIDPLTYAHLNQPR